MRIGSLVVTAAVLTATLAAGAARLTQSEAEAAVKAVIPDIQDIRGFKFTKPVPVSVIDDAKARDYALARFKRLTPESKIRSDQNVFRLLGLVPKDLDVLKALLDVLEEQAGGFYDPTTKSFYLLDDMPKNMTGLLTAHEMTHALEDQRYDIDGRIAKVLDDDDASFALSSLVEGSASLAAAIYVAKGIASGTLDAEALAGMSDAVKTERLNAMPDALKRQLLGPYVLGVTFLSRAHGGGTGAEFPLSDVDAAWARPPRSSEQILHPEKYWDAGRRDNPKPVTMPSPKTVLGKGWTLAGSGVLGELMLGSLVGAEAPDTAALVSGGGVWTNAAASGWGGDRFELWSTGASSLVLVLTVWDTAKDADEFAAALPAGRSDFGFRKQGKAVAIVAGAGGERRAALLALLAPR
jgi:hypothetical protein